MEKFTVIVHKELINRIGVNIKAIRDAKEWKQIDLAVRAKTTASIISGIENGKTMNTSIITLIRIANALEVPITDLFK